MLSRRDFLSSLAAAGAVSMAGIHAQSDPIRTISSQKTVTGSMQRRNQAYKIRKMAALHEKNRPMPQHPVNGDEQNLPGFISSFSKTLPHNALGEADGQAYQMLLDALSGNDPSAYESIPHGGGAKLVNPQAGFCFGMEGADSFHMAIPAAPSFSSEDQGAEMAEDYWHALLRDIPFSQYTSDSLAAAAVSDLGNFSRFSGVTAGSLFRTPFAGVETGPYISQLLWNNVPYGPSTIVQQYKVPLPGSDFLTNYQEWLNVQNGLPPAKAITFDSAPRYIRNGRDLGEYLRLDFSYQAYLNAALILQTYGLPALSDANPYKSLTRQAGFATFGAPHVLDIVARAGNEALVACWYQKWSLHRRIRPEAFAGRVHNHMIHAANYPIHSKLLNSQAVQETVNRNGTYLLPQGHPPGCPAHPSYPAGHAAISGACATLLKAFFNENFVIPNPVVATDDGLSLAAYIGDPLTLGGELNKLACNISIGRDIAGVHWRSDGEEGMRLGEQVAINLLRDYRDCFHESFNGFAFTSFDGDAVTI